MENYDLKNIKKYSPDNSLFLKKSIELFRSEIIIYIENLKKIKETKNLNDLRLIIHKIKPSSELFCLPNPILNVLYSLYDLSDPAKKLNDYENEKIETKIDDLIKFYTLLCDELLKPLNKIV